jgi:uncharacterized protein YdaU (DUF1376 family)
MTKDAPAFDFYPERWTHGTRHMTKAERCDYIDLLCHQWTNDGLPADLDLIARMIGYKKGAQIPALVLEKFPLSEDGKRRNCRLEQERDKQRERIARKSLGAAKTNAKRWGERVANESLSDRLATPERVASESPPPTTHRTPIQERESNAREDWPDLNQVLAFAETVPADISCATSFFNECEACGWVNKHGHAIRDWRALFRNYATRWRTNDFQRSRQNSNGKPRNQAYDPQRDNAGKTREQMLNLIPGAEQ